jgi:hypothetical protein
VSVFWVCGLILGSAELRGGVQDAAPAGDACGRTVLMPSRVGAHFPVGARNLRKVMGVIRGCMGRCGRGRRDQSDVKPRRGVGGRIVPISRWPCLGLLTPRPSRPGNGSLRHVTQPVEDEGEQLAGRGDLGDVCGRRCRGG